MADKPNILYIDDTEDNLLVMSGMLEDFDINLITGTSGKQALQLILKYDFALILLDVVMPEMSGIETAELIRKQINTPIIFLTVDEDNDQNMLKSYEIGATDYLIKPVRQVILKSKVKSFLTIYEQRKLIEKATEQVSEINIKLIKEIEEHERTTITLQESETRYRQLVEVSPDMIIVDKKDKIAFINPAGSKILGASNPEQIIGKSFFDFLDPEYHENIKERIRLLKKGKRDMSLLERKLIKLDGTTIHAEISCVSFTDQGEIAILFVARDISKRKKAEEKLKIYAEKLKLSNQELEDFAFVASHDLREPLRKIEAFSNQLKTKHSNDLSEKGQDCLDRMQNAAIRMQNLINGLLTYSRITTGAIPFIQTNLTKVIQDVVSDLEIRIDETKGRIEVDNLPSIDADPVQIHQLFQNLIDNALKYHKPGEPPVVKIQGQLIKEPSDTQSKSPDIKSNEVCQIIVQDNGIGFDKKHHDQIFEIFQRLHSRRTYEGTGIGLSICRKIIERHGGSITANSVEGEGVTFVITLPIKQPN